MLTVNLFAGPGTGKSTTAAGVFSKLKIGGINTELVTEYAKDKVWDQHHAILNNQIYIFAKQYQRLFRLKGQVDVAITDSPLPLTLLYNKSFHGTFDKLVVEVFDSFDNMNIFLKRKKPYSQKGRYQNEEQARELDGKTLELLGKLGVEYDEIGCEDGAIDRIYSAIMERAGDRIGGETAK